MEKLLAFGAFALGLLGGGAWGVVASGYTVGLSNVALAMTPCWLVLLAALGRAAQGKLSAGAKGWCLVGAVLAGLVFWDAHERVSFRARSIVVRSGLACYGFQCKLGAWLADAHVDLAERRDVVRALSTTGTPGRPIPVGAETLRPSDGCRYQVDGLVLRCVKHDVPTPLTRGDTVFPPPCPGPVRIAPELTATPASR